MPRWITLAVRTAAFAPVVAMLWMLGLPLVARDARPAWDFDLDLAVALGASLLVSGALALAHDARRPRP